jgi:hypothetical protein
MPGQCVLGVFSIFHRQPLAERRARQSPNVFGTAPNHCECLGPRISLSLDWPWLRKQKKKKSGQGFLLSIKLIRKVRQRQHRNPLFRHIRYEISKNGEKKVRWASTGHQTEFSSQFGAKPSLPCPFFS